MNPWPVGSSLPAPDQALVHTYCRKSAAGWLGLGDWQSAKAELDELTPTLRAHPDVLKMRVAIHCAARQFDRAATISDTLADRVSFARLIKVYKNNPEDQRRYSPGEVVEVEAVPVFGNPDPDRICTSIVERQNLTIRMQMRRLTRLTNAFSKKWENLWAAYCLHFAYYNFCRVHRSLRVTPAMETKITDHIWEISELLA